tara:strand:- start:320 stop:901 length:582 start_codon:yes stop_codon:yes gene_type:complete
MIFKSFARTWIAFFKGDLSPEQLRDAPEMQFNCSEEHLFPSEETREEIGLTFPMEASWAGGMTKYYTQRLPETIVPIDIAIQFREFLAIARELIDAGRLTFDRSLDDGSSSPSYSREAMWSFVRHSWLDTPRDWSTAPVKRGDRVLFGRYLGTARDVLASMTTTAEWCVQVTWRHPDDGSQVSWAYDDEVRPW